MQTAIIISLMAVLFAYLASFKTFKYGLEIAMLIITAFVAIRYEWGTDMPGYNFTFQEFANSGLRAFDFTRIAQIRAARSLEIGWAFLNIICSPIGFFGMIILLAVVENFIIYDFIKRNVDKDYYWLAVFIYTFNPYMMVLGCSMLRQWLAMCIILFATRYISSGKWRYYILYVLLAASFHTSALLFTFLYLFRYVKDIKLDISSITWLGAISLIWIVIGGFLSMEVIMMLLSTDAFEGYTGQIDPGSGTGAGLGFGSLYKVLIYLFCIVQVKNLDGDKKVLSWLLFAYVLLFPFTDAVALASRLNFYIDAIAIAVVPIAMKTSKYKSINVVLILLYVFWNCMLYRMFFSASSYFWGYRTYHTIFETTWQ